MSEEYEEEGVAEALDQLSQSRRATRELGYTTLNRELKFGALYSIVEGKVETIVEHISTSLRKGNASERVLALRCLALLVLVCGEEEDVETLILGQRETLQRFIQHPQSAAVAAEAARALAVGVFVDVRDPSVVEEVVDVLAKACQAATLEKVRAELLECWALLVSSMRSRQVVEGVLSHSAWLAPLLGEGSFESRAAAGWAIAVLCHAFKEEQKNSGTEYDFYDMDGWLEVDDVIEDLDELTGAAMPSRRQGQAKKWRKTFKVLSEVIAEGEEPSETLEFNKHKFEVRGVAQWVQINFLRAVLNEGLQEHIYHNPLVENILGWEVPEWASTKWTSKAEKRLLQGSNTPLARVNSNHMKKAREKKRAQDRYDQGFD